MVIKALILVYYKQSLKIIVETDLSNYINGKIFY